jgi:hypothetical protein
MPIMVGSSQVDAIYVGSQLVDASFVGSSAVTSTGGAPASGEYAGDGVLFPQGSFLQQASSAIANTAKLTLSMWACIPSMPSSGGDGADYVAVYTAFHDTADDTDFSVDYVMYGMIVAPNLLAHAADGGGIVSDLRIFAASDTAGISAYSTGRTTHAFTVPGANIAGLAALMVIGDAVSDILQLVTPSANLTDLNFVAGSLSLDTIDAFTIGDMHHIYIAVDLAHAQNAKLYKFYLDAQPIGQRPGFPVDVGGSSSIALNGKRIGFPGTARWSDTQPPEIILSDVQVWTDYFDPDGLQNTYSAKPTAGRTIIELVDYMNTRDVSPVEALAVMKIESNFGAQATNYFQFLDQASFNSILGYTGVKTKALDLNRALANAWTDLRPNGSSVAAPNNYDGIVEGITGTDALGWQKFVIHNLGGSVSAIGAAGSINGYRLLSAWVENEDLLLSQVGGLTLMLAQTSIYGSTGPIGAVTGSTTVGQAVGAMITVWDNAVTAAMTKLDANTSTNLRYFIDDDGYAVEPGAATDKFGTQQILLTGPAGTFIENQGNGGAFTLTGSVFTVAGPNG